MEVLELNGANYVKASRVARDLGYTADYVGQLCRSGKVDAQLVGRSWYVNEDSIKSHKQSRYRSTKAKSIGALKRIVHSEPIHNEQVNEIEISNAAVGQSGSTVSHFYKKLKPLNTKYSEDQTELIPTLKERQGSVEPTKLEVELAEASNVPIKRVKKPYKLSPTPRPKIRFTGNITLIEPDDADQSEVAATKSTNHKAGGDKQLLQSAKPTAKIKSSQVRSPQAKLSRIRSNVLTVADIDKTDQPTAIPLQKGRIVAMKRYQSRPPVKSTELVIVESAPTTSRTGRASFVYITTSVVAAVVLGFSIVLLEHSVTSDPGSSTISTGYNFNLSAVMDAFKVAK